MSAKTTASGVSSLSRNAGNFLFFVGLLDILEKVETGDGKGPPTTDSIEDEDESD
jgi:hypothetical protein